MTKYKKYLKEKGYKFSEDYDFLPHEHCGLTIEDADAYVCKYGIMVIKVYTSYVSRTFITGDRSNFFIDVYDEDDDLDVTLLRELEIRKPYNDRYYYCFDEGEKLVAVLTPHNKLAQFFEASI